MNANLLKSFMVCHGDTIKDIAAFLDLSETSVCNKINERGTEFKQGEIAKIRDRYNLSADQIESIFFN